MVFLCTFEAALDPLDVLLRSGDAMLRLLLEAMPDIDCLSEFHGIHRPVSIPILVIDNFQDPCPAKALEGCGICVFLAFLGEIERVSITSCTSSGNVFRSAFALPIQNNGFRTATRVGHYEHSGRPRRVPLR